ncbi:MULTISPECIES: hypothetical protein [Cyanophyceae]|nr:hypothetical protein [Trichocoleus sp. FACHB-69]MBD1930474.1 hypothetical protein [Trichocoleus sp. FACHB-69]
MLALFRLQKLLADSPVGAVLFAIALLNLPGWWLGGGAVRNTVEAIAI